MRYAAVLLFLSFFISCSSGPADKAKEYKTPEQLAAEDKKFEECRAKLKKANEPGAPYNMDIKDGRPPAAVGPTFYTIPSDAKEGFADTVNGFLVAGQNKYVEFKLLDYRTNKIVAIYHWGKPEME